MKKILALMMGLALAAPAAAQNPQVDLPPGLERRLKEIEKTLRNLEPRVAEVERRLPQSDLPPRRADPWARPDGMKAPQVVLTEAQFRSLYPNHQLSAQGVPASVPFVPARSTTPGTTVHTVTGWPSSPVPAATRSSAPAPYPGLTYTVVPPATSGGTSGCANGNCANQSSGRLFGRWR